MAKRRKLTRGQAANLRQLYSSYKRRAKRKKQAFSLTLERFHALTKAPCLICGAKPKQRYRHSAKRAQYKSVYLYNGIDRVDSRKGYVDGNCAPCCWRCNRAKGPLSLEQFMLYILEAYNHSIKPAIEQAYNHSIKPTRNDKS